MGVGSSGSSLSWIKTYPDIMMLPANQIQEPATLYFPKMENRSARPVQPSQGKMLEKRPRLPIKHICFFIKRSFQLTLKLRVSAGRQRNVPEHAGSGGGA